MDTRHDRKTTTKTRIEELFAIFSSDKASIEADAAKGDRSRLGFTAFAFFIHALALGVMFFVPPDPWGLASEELLSTDDRLVPYELMAMEMIEQEVEVAETPQSTETAGGQGQRHQGAEGQMGRPDAAKIDNHYAIKGPADNPDPHMARERQKELAEHSGILAALRSNSPTSPFGQDTALGLDVEDAMGLLMGNQPGDSFGYDGLGVRGSGRGGGGDGLGTIGLGNFFKIGHGAGGGPNGQGYGTGNGRLRGRPSGQGPTVAITSGTNVRGSLSSDTIRRYIRRNLNSIRYCYEQELVRRPDLEGRVAVRFVISGGGAVASSTVDSSTLGDASAEQCVARAVQRIGFPQTDDGGVVIVTYPFMFQSAE